jgi:hypothetical protein
LIPRRTPEERERNHIAETHRSIQQYIKKGCEGDLKLSNSPIKILPDNLIHAKENLILDNSKIEDLNNLERVDKYFGLYNCKNLKTLGNLNYTGSTLDLEYTNIESLENLEYVGRSLVINSTLNLKSLGKLKFVGVNLYVSNSNILKVMSDYQIRQNVEIKGEIIII